MPEFVAIAVFDRPSLEQLKADLDKYLAQPGEAYMLVKQHRHDYAVQVCDENGNGGDNINAGKPCPGSPGCP
jgi:hypothetical protein